MVLVLPGDEEHSSNQTNEYRLMLVSTLCRGAGGELRRKRTDERGSSRLRYQQKCMNRTGVLVRVIQFDRLTMVGGNCSDGCDNSKVVDAGR